MDYSKTSVVDLKKICKEKKLKGYSKMKKREIIDLLQERNKGFVSPIRPSLTNKYKRKTRNKVGPPKTPSSPLLRRIVKKNKKKEY